MRVCARFAETSRRLIANIPMRVRTSADRDRCVAPARAGPPPEATEPQSRGAVWRWRIVRRCRRASRGALAFPSKPWLFCQAHQLALPFRTSWVISRVRDFIRAANFSPPRISGERTSGSRAGKAIGAFVNRSKRAEKVCAWSSSLRGSLLLRVCRSPTTSPVWTRVSASERCRRVATAACRAREVVQPREQWVRSELTIDRERVTLLSTMIFTGRSVDALDEVRDTTGTASIVVQSDARREVNAVAIAAGWFSSLRRPGRKHKKNYQKQAKSAWDLSSLSVTVSRNDEVTRNLLEIVEETQFSPGASRTERSFINRDKRLVNRSIIISLRWEHIRFIKRCVYRCMFQTFQLHRRYYIDVWNIDLYADVKPRR